MFAGVVCCELPFDALVDADAPRCFPTLWRAAAPRAHGKAHDPSVGMWASPVFLVVLAVLLGLIPMTLAGPLVSAVSAAVIGEAAPPLELALWHGVNPALGMSLGAVAVGTLMVWQHAGLLRAYESLRHLDARTLFDRGLGLADRRVRKLIVASHAPSLQRMLLATFAVVVALVIEGAVTGGGSLTGMRAGQPASAVAVIAWGLLIAATLAVVVAQRQRFLVLVYVSVIGLVIALAFVHLSAPDLALTQISVEVVTILLLLLALNLLPKTPVQLSGNGRRLRDAALGIGGGLGVGGAAWAMLTRDANDPISRYHIANSY
ncbi:MAG: DUF4040 domain-containing protein, partial [Novosphingobium sp.]|nr:DUF4040 domain-containing protein [Novosphingobium sp.]